jgi:hypothetical protein
MRELRVPAAEPAGVLPKVFYRGLGIFLFRLNFEQ